VKLLLIHSGPLTRSRVATIEELPAAEKVKQRLHRAINSREIAGSPPGA